MVGNQLPFPWSVRVCLAPGSCSVFLVLAPFWHTDGTARVLLALVLVVFWRSRERALRVDEPPYLSHTGAAAPPCSCVPFRSVEWAHHPGSGAVELPDPLAAGAAATGS